MMMMNLMVIIIMNLVNISIDRYLNVVHNIAKCSGPGFGLASYVTKVI